MLEHIPNRKIVQKSAKFMRVLAQEKTILPSNYCWYYEPEWGIEKIIRSTAFQHFSPENIPHVRNTGNIHHSIHYKN